MTCLSTTKSEHDDRPLRYEEIAFILDAGYMVSLDKNGEDSAHFAVLKSREEVEVLASLVGRQARVFTMPTVILLAVAPDRCFPFPGGLNRMSHMTECSAFANQVMDSMIDCASRMELSAARYTISPISAKCVGNSSLCETLYNILGSFVACGVVGFSGVSGHSW